MPKPVVVIIGRPNVGKSTLFNRMVGYMSAIVEDVPGVTRDRNYKSARWEEKDFVVVDTGGFYTKTPDNIFEQIKEQALFAIEEADVIVHLLDGKEGLNPYDSELTDILRASGRKVIWAVNKIDSLAKESRLYEFFSLGVGEPIAVSAAMGHNYDELMDRIAQELPDFVDEPVEYPRVAVIGRPNVGKSTLINALLGKKRMLVSPVPGTTRDAVDSICSYYSRKYVLVDTAGIRRKHKLGYSLERFALLRAMRAIERSDVCIILIDANEGIVADDQQIAGMAKEAGRGAILLLNKFDLVENPDQRLKELGADISKKLWFYDHAPVLTTSGLTRKRITKIFPLIDGVHKRMQKKIPTPALNRFLGKLSMPPYKGRAVKLLYMVQVGQNPPVFKIFANRPEGVKDAQVKFITSKLREEFPLEGVPVTIMIRARA